MYFPVERPQFFVQVCDRSFDSGFYFSIAVCSLVAGVRWRDITFFFLYPRDTIFRNYLEGTTTIARFAV